MDGDALPLSVGDGGNCLLSVLQVAIQRVSALRLPERNSETFGRVSRKLLGRNTLEGLAPVSIPPLFLGVAMGEATRITLLDRVRQTQAGDSWDEFAAVYDAMIQAWLRQQAIPDADADDIRQEVMQTVVQEIANFDHNGRPGAFRNWLRRITANRMRRLWQKRGRRSDDDAGADIGAMADQLEDDASRLTHVWDADHDRFVLNRLLALLNGRFSAKSLAAFRRLAIACFARSRSLARG
jgi:DNA-directed RNA polymerase specialized sigma24 family protein